MTLQLCCTVNVFNVLYLEEVAGWINTQDFDFVYWNMMHDAYYFSIATLPAQAKLAIAEQLTNAQVNKNTRKEFDQIIDFMNAGTSLDGNILRIKIEDLDRKRGQDLRLVEPELAQLIEYNGPN
jgi:hypothetical protein